MMKKCKVIMLPADKDTINVGDIVKLKDNLPLLSATEFDSDNSYGLGWRSQYLYVISDEESYETGDWILSPTSIKPLYVDGRMIYPGMLNDNWNKVIASTDPELGLKAGLSWIPDEFIRCYNHTPVSHVEIEYCGANGCAVIRSVTNDGWEVLFVKGEHNVEGNGLSKIETGTSWDSVFKEWYETETMDDYTIWLENNYYPPTKIK